ncbi:MAG: tRNA (N6-threonylcarbamoyladenosine(37)-N6)-methyltransferase TrmO [Anaerolineales bacterium]|nr:tRNA (N6-threonylcarbamoyladenosine(37)-N6)-methyltransferase TrmO [Anaerolineales bacterium]
MNDKTAENTFSIKSIGQVRRLDEGIRLDIAEPYRPAMAKLEHFSHVMVFWWADQLDDEESRGVLQCNPPYAEEYVTGVFATRSPLRPNPIALSTCRILDVDHQAGSIKIDNIDALEGTPIVDLKAYFPVCDRVRKASIPEWLSDWPEWMPEEGIGLEPWEE